MGVTESGWGFVELSIFAAETSDATELARKILHAVLTPPKERPERLNVASLHHAVLYTAAKNTPGSGRTIAEICVGIESMSNRAFNDGLKRIKAASQTHAWLVDVLTPPKEELEAVAAAATDAFDSTPIPSPFTSDPTTPNYPLAKLGGVTDFPSDLIYFFRATQILRALTEHQRRTTAMPRIPSTLPMLMKAITCVLSCS